MRRIHKLELALARARNARAKLRNAGALSGEDHSDRIDFDEAEQLLDRSMMVLERMLERAISQ